LSRDPQFRFPPVWKSTSLADYPELLILSGSPQFTREQIDESQEELTNKVARVSAFFFSSNPGASLAALVGRDWLLAIL